MVLVDKNKCIACGVCTTICPAGAIALSDSEQQYAIINYDLCMECFTCVETCPQEAIYKDNSK